MAFGCRISRQKLRFSLTNARLLRCSPEIASQGLDKRKESDKEALEREQKNFKLKVKKQEKLLYVALHLLLNLADDIGIEKKMRK